MSTSAILRVLIVEDEALLAMDLESMVIDAGHRVVGEAASLEEAAALPPDLRPDVALIDIQLADGSNGLDVAALIQARWPAALVVFVTANAKQVPPDFAGGHGVLAKPYSRGGMLSTLRHLSEGLYTPPPTTMLPANFIAAPALARRWAH